jgi:hypothetical protein
MSTARSTATPTAPIFPNLPLESLADLDALVVRKPFADGLATDAADFAGSTCAAKAVLVHTGWDRHWRTETYFDNHPFLTAAAADWLVEQGAAFVGIDSHNIDDTRTRSRPVHSKLLAAGIPIGEHLTNSASPRPRLSASRRSRPRSREWGPSRCGLMRGWRGSPHIARISEIQSPHAPLKAAPKGIKAIRPANRTLAVPSASSAARASRVPSPPSVATTFLVEQIFDPGFDREVARDRDPRAAVEGQRAGQGAVIVVVLILARR